MLHYSPYSSTSSQSFLCLKSFISCILHIEYCDIKIHWLFNSIFFFPAICPTLKVYIHSGQPQILSTSYIFCVFLLNNFWWIFFLVLECPMSSLNKKILPVKLHLIFSLFIKLWSMLWRQIKSPLSCPWNIVFTLYGKHILYFTVLLLGSQI